MYRGIVEPHFSYCCSVGIKTVIYSNVLGEFQGCLKFKRDDKICGKKPTSACNKLRQACQEHDFGLKELKNEYADTILARLQV